MPTSLASLWRRIVDYEFWNPRLFELPYYLYLGLLCLVNRIGIRTLAKANYAFDHGEISLGSKYDSQLKFDQKYFLPTEFMAGALSSKQKADQIALFAQTHGWPVILKPDVGYVGKGIVKVKSHGELDGAVDSLVGDYLIQQYAAQSLEYGVFYVRQNGKSIITGINKKHFPTVVGNGEDDILTLARRHSRYSEHWPSFLKYIDVTRVPSDAEQVQVSFIGSHTMGCMFTDDTHLLTPELEKVLFEVCESQPGFNFGRVDVKAESEEAFRAGRLVVIEINGVPSMPTHMFDPEYNVFQAYRIFLRHARYLAEVACEHRHEPMDLLPVGELLKRIKESRASLEAAHGKLSER